MNIMDKKLFKENLNKDLHQYLVGIGVVDEKLPECPDLEEIWPDIERAYIPDAIREFEKYPIVTLGWIMFVGMALAKLWDDDWVQHSAAGGTAMYVAIRDARGFDNLDDNVLEGILGLDKENAEKESAIVGECAARTFSMIQHSGVEPGTPKAVEIFEIALHELYTMGIAMELNALGYHMTLLGQ